MMGPMLPIAPFLGFLVLPVLEIYVIIQVGTVIGGWPTVALLLVESLLGAWIVRREGRRAWRALRQSFSGGEMHDRELADAGLILIGGALLLTPGFLTDVAGFMFVLPFTRPLVRRALARYVGRRVRITQERMVQRMSATVAEGVFPGAPAHHPGAGQDGPVIRGEVLREDRPEPCPGPPRREVTTGRSCHRAAPPVWRYGPVRLRRARGQALLRLPARRIARRSARTSSRSS